jgi:radical SAM protein with 4Fe4S-binding SPASM domain
MKRFKKIYIEITNVCNLKCEFCPTTNREPKFMEVNEFRFILENVKDYTDYIYLHIKGEPLLHPNLGEILDLAYDYGKKVNLTTNGTLLGKNKELLLTKPALRQINISLHSLEQNSWYNDKEKYMEDIINFIDEVKTLNIIIALRLWNLVENIDENIVKNEFILKNLIELLDLDNRLLEGFNMMDEIKVRDRLYLNKDLEFIWPSLDNNIYSEEGFCYGLRDQLGILVDGTVVPCCLDGEGIINLGSIFQDGLKEILKSKRTLDIYNKFSNRHVHEEFCKRCGYRLRFK